MRCYLLAASDMAAPLYCISGTMPVEPLGDGKLTLGAKIIFFADFFMLAAPLHRFKVVSSTNVLVGYKGECHLCLIGSPSPNNLAGVSGNGNTLNKRRHQN
jgi:hypothetical protein